MAALEANANDQTDSNKLLDLLRIFLDAHGLGSEELAGLLRITPQTLEEWFSEGTAPPAAFLALAVLFSARKRMSGRDGFGQQLVSARRATQANRGQDDRMLRMVRAI